MMLSLFFFFLEGNSNLVNFDNTVGACGFVPHFAKSFYPVTLVRSDEQGIPLKDATGKCIRCKTGDVGVFIGKISSNAARSFSGYADKVFQIL